MKVITLLNEKGGVGKTTLATHIAAGLALRGYRTVLVDADPQGHATQSVGHAKSGGLYELLLRDADFSDVLRPVRPEVFTVDTSPGEFYLVPGNDETRGIPVMNPNAMIMRDRFEELRGWADYIVFDTAPTPSLIHASIYLATDGIIYPTHCNYLSIDGLAASILHREMAEKQRIQEGFDQIKTMGIQPTMYRSGTEAHDVGLRHLAREFKSLLWPSLPLRTMWEKASWAGEMLFRYAPEDISTDEAWALVDRVLKQMKVEA